jgi:hypothetical protein
VKADLTRSSFDPLKHFSQVLMQQGRVQLDADWNEQAAILLHLVRRLASDIFPDGVGGRGFEIAALDTKNPLFDDFVVGAGDLWVDGILCELEATPVDVLIPDQAKPQITVAAWTVDAMPFAVGQYLSVGGDDPTNSAVAVTGKITAAVYATATLTLDADLAALKNATNLRATRLVTYKSQPGGLPDAQRLAAGKQYQIYLDVWERLITSLEDDSIREVALNGPDTAARTQVVWQVRAFEFPAQAAPGGKGKTPPAPPPSLPECMAVQALDDALRRVGAGLLQARTQPAQESTDPCTISPDSRYRGPENQLYRVEVHAGRAAGADPARIATFKFSRENGSAVFPILKLDDANGTTTVRLGNLGRDDRFGLQPGDFVEIQDDRSVLANTVMPLLKVSSVDRSAMLVTLDGSAGVTAGADSSLHPLLRRWDQKAGNPSAGGLELVAGAARIAGDVWLDLEDGVQVRFPRAGQASYRSGDYWLIPARVATGNVIWATETETDAQGTVTVHQVAQPPNGVSHHYAPLAVLGITDGQAPAMRSCMPRFDMR